MAAMTKKAKVPSSSLTVDQESMIVNFEEAAFDYPRESFAKITRRMLGQRGFARSRNRAAFERECRKAFDVGRDKPSDEK